MKLVDTHCHLDFDRYQQDLDQVLSRAWNQGLERIMIPGIDLESSRRVIKLASTDHRLFAAVGVHPNSAETWDQKSASRLRSLASHPGVIAIGEIGLDYYRNPDKRDLQERVLSEQLDIALELELPVILHVRNQSGEDRSCIMDLINILEGWTKKAVDQGRDQKQDRWGVVHSFSGHLEEARKLASLGFFLGITGPVTYPGAEEMQRVAAQAPRSRLLIETDGPFLTPHPHRGKRNEPAYVKFVAEKISELMDVPVGEAAVLTTENADHLFEWS